MRDPHPGCIASPAVALIIHLVKGKNLAKDDRPRAPDRGSVEDGFDPTLDNAVHLDVHFHALGHLTPKDMDEAEGSRRQKVNDDREHPRDRDVESREVEPGTDVVVDVLAMGRVLPRVVPVEVDQQGDGDEAPREEGRSDERREERRCDPAKESVSSRARLRHHSPLRTPALLPLGETHRLVKLCLLVDEILFVAPVVEIMVRLVSGVLLGVAHEA